MNRIDFKQEDDLAFSELWTPRVMWIFMGLVILMSVLFPSCASSKKVVTEETQIEYINLSGGIVKDLTKKLTRTAAVAKLSKIQLFLGNPNLKDSQAPLVAERKFENKITEISNGKLISKTEEKSDVCTFKVGLKGQVIDYDSTKMLLKVSFVDGDNSKFLIMGLDSIGNFRTATINPKIASGNKIEWEGKIFDITSEIVNVEIFFNSENLNTLDINNLEIEGRSVVPVDLSKKQKKSKH